MKPSRFLVVLLLIAIALLTGVNIYQNRVIAKQSSEIHKLLAHCGMRVPPPAPAKQ